MSAELYHLHHQKHLEDIPFWKKLAVHYGSPILELGCGTGRVTTPLFHEGFDITGVDMDPDMLDVFKRVNKDNESINSIQADFTELNVEKKFALILMPCNTYSTLSNENRQKVLKVVDDHIETGGAFSFSLPNPAWLQGLPAKAEPELEEILIHPENSDAVQVSSAWQNKGDRVEVYWHYDRLLSDGQVKRITKQTTHILNTVSQYIDELEKLNYSWKTYGGFDRSPYSPDSDYLIVVANKKN